MKIFKRPLSISTRFLILLYFFGISIICVIFFNTWIIIYRAEKQSTILTFQRLVQHYKEDFESSLHSVEKICSKASQRLVHVMNENSDPEEFNQRYELCSDGSTRTIKELSFHDIATVGIFKEQKIDNEFKKTIITIDRHFTDIVKPLSGLVSYSYLCGKFWGINYPSEWTYRGPGIYDNSKDIYYYLVDPEHNPEKNPLWTPVYYDHILQKWMTSYVIPIYKNQEFLGIFGNDVYIEQVFSKINKLNVLKTGYAFILDQEGNLVAHPDYQDLISRSGDKMGDHLDTKDVGDKHFRSIMDEIRGQHFLSNNKMILTKNDYTLIRTSVNPLHWSLVLYIPNDELVAGFKTWTWVYLCILFTFIILASMLFFRFLQRNIFSPLKKLSHKMEVVKKVDYDMIREKIGKAEIGDLANSFYTMVDCIKQNEEMVKKHATKLLIMNEQLHQEIDVRKQTEQSLHKREAYFRAIFEGVDDISFIITDLSGTDARILDFNPGAEYIFGYKREEVIGKPFSILHLPEDIVKFPETVKSMGQAKKGFSGEYTLVRKSGEKFLAFFKAYPIFDDEGNMIAAVGISIDISKHKKMEEELLKVQKMEAIGVLAGGIAHDFNNFLTSIIGNLSLAELAVRQGDNLFATLTSAKKAAEQATQLTQQLLTFSKGGAPVKEPAYILDLIKETASFSLSGSKVKCDCSAPDNLWTVEIDKGQISQVINNLIINANHAMPEGGIISINIENAEIGMDSSLPIKKGKYLKISIKDQGVGIPKESLHKVFDPFFTTKREGSGLGLTTCHSIVKKHGGHISVESEPRIGTTFYIYLPALEKDIFTVEHIVEEVIYAGKGRILFMDDEQDVINTGERILTQLGYEVETAKDGAEALECYRKAKEELGSPFDAVILDLTVQGGMGGEEVINKLREIDPQVKAIVSSGYSNDPVLSNYSQYGFIDVVAKPYEVKELSKVLYRVIKGKGEPIRS